MTAIDAFICVHEREINYLLELVLRAYDAHYGPKGRLFLICNNPAALRAFLDEKGLAPDAIISDDRDWLSESEAALPGWFKQQIIKLRAHAFCTTANFANIGADTVLLRPIHAHDLVHDDRAILYYTRHAIPDQHFLFERERVRHVGRILGVDPVEARRYTDFINDLFCFNREWLLGLNANLEANFGRDPYSNLLRGLTNTRNRFGEWTLYSVYLLDVLRAPVTLRSTGGGYLAQIHSRRMLRLYRFNTRVAHFVGKDFDVAYIEREIAARRLLPAPVAHRAAKRKTLTHPAVAAATDANIDVPATTPVYTGDGNTAVSAAMK